VISVPVESPEVTLPDPSLLQEDKNRMAEIERKVKNLCFIRVGFIS
jgi:hypothetical protein